MILTLQKLPSAALSTVCTEVPEYEFGQEMADFCQNMLDTMRIHRGVGIAAPQVGVTKRVIVWAWGDDLENVFQMVNPKIELAGSTKIDFEGCLSVPGRQAKVSRSDTVNVTWQDPMTGAVQSETLTGFKARVMQHEYDHLDGVTIMDRKVRQ